MAHEPSAKGCHSGGEDPPSVVDLTVNLKETAFVTTPKMARRLSMSNLTPDINGGLRRTPLGLTKTALRISNSNNTGAATATAATRGVFRRFNSTPLASTAMSSPGHSGNKENMWLPPIPPMATMPPTEDVSAAEEPANPLRNRAPMDIHDPNSQDSGYAVEDQRSLFRFAEPSGLAPRKSTIEPSPKKLISSPRSPCSKPRSSSSISSGDRFSFCSTESFDDGFLELSDLDKSFPDENSENTAAPVGLGNLLTGQLISTAGDTLTPKEEEMFSLRTVRRCNSLMETQNLYTPPASSKIRVGLFKEASPMSPMATSYDSPSEKPFKRPRDLENNSAKRRKSNSLQVISDNSPREFTPVTSRYKIQRSISETTATNLAAMLHKSYATPDLIGDFSRPFALPLVSGRHDDLKSISPETMAGLMKGDFAASVSSYKIIDCRYPYEYDGGHIKGSVNLYTKEQIERELMDGGSRTDDPGDRSILVFHCEFSLERGPTLSRYLRQRDRLMNSYPALHFPEVYLLHGGYHNFFTTYKPLCDPCSYLPMCDPKHVSDLKKFRGKSNSWSGAGGVANSKPPSKHNGLKRLGL